MTSDAIREDNFFGVYCMHICNSSYLILVDQFDYIDVNYMFYLLLNPLSYITFIVHQYNI